MCGRPWGRGVHERLAVVMSGTSPTMVGSTRVEGYATEREHFEAVSAADGYEVCECVKWCSSPVFGEPRGYSFVGFRCWLAATHCVQCDGLGLIPTADCADAEPNDESPF